MPQRYSHIQVPCMSKETGPAQMSINWRMDSENVAHVQNGISFSCKAKGNYRIYRQMNGNGNCRQWMSTKFKETDSSCSFYSVEQSFEFLHLCVWFWVSIETRKLERGHVVGRRGLIWGRMTIEHMWTCVKWWLKGRILGAVRFKWRKGSGTGGREDSRGLYDQN